MKSFAQLDEKGRQFLESRILRYLATWPEGLSTKRMRAWVDSCTKGGGYTVLEYEAAIRSLRDSGRIAIACEVWYIRKVAP